MSNIANLSSTTLVSYPAALQSGATPQVTVSTIGAGAGLTSTKLTTIDGLNVDLTSGFAETIVSGSARFVIGGKTYVEREGILYHSIDPTTGSGTQAGTLAAGEGIAHLSDWTAGNANTIALQSLVTQTNLPPINSMAFRLSVVPARPGSVQIRATPTVGDTLILTPDSSGVINTSDARGQVDYVTGVVWLEFGHEVKLLSGNRPTIEAQPWYDVTMEYHRDGDTYIREPLWIIADSVRYNEVGYTYLPLDADILGLDPVRLPSDGRVPMVRVGNLVVIHHNGVQSLATVPAVGTVLNAGRANLATVRLIGFDGIEIDPAKYTTDLAAGTVTITQSLTGTATPITFEHRVEDMARVVDVQINGLVQINPPITHDYPLGSLASTALLIGDLQARFDAATVFAQEVMTNTWMDTRQGDVVFAQYNQALYPIVVANRGCETERWAIRFTSATAFVVIGEHVGQIAIGSINQDCSPVNPATNTPYFTLLAAGWGTGWAAGNVLRFNTVSATYPLWLARTIQPGASSVINDQISIEIRGDIDRP